MIEWIVAIPFTEWNQQELNRIKPAMMHTLDWHDFGKHAQPVINSLVNKFSWKRTDLPMLSVVLPGDDIPPHVDLQDPNWLFRVHIPLTTNDQAFFNVNGVDHHMKIGCAYKVNTLDRHGISNRGTTPRIHFMFDVLQ